MMVGFAKMHLTADAEAVTWFRRSLEANRNYPIAHFALAAGLALLGSLDEARTAAQAGFALDPSFTIRRFRLGASSDNPTYLTKRERLYEGMRLAGVPEGEHGEAAMSEEGSKPEKLDASICFPLCP
jgi:hypothetical protein